jgi:hypothetical protein
VVRSIVTHPDTLHQLGTGLVLETMDDLKTRDALRTSWRSSSTNRRIRASALTWRTSIDRSNDVRRSRTARRIPLPIVAGTFELAQRRAPRAAPTRAVQDRACFPVGLGAGRVSMGAGHAPRSTESQSLSAAPADDSGRQEAFLAHKLLAYRVLHSGSACILSRACSHLPRCVRASPRTSVTRQAACSLGVEAPSRRIQRPCWSRTGRR